MLRTFLIIGLGGALGSMARYAVTLWASRWTTNFPLATFIVNLAGCLIIGLVFGLASRNNWLQRDVWFLVATGSCGGFTTFSAFALENNQLLDKNAATAALVYTLISVILGILLCRLGMMIAKM